MAKIFVTGGTGFIGSHLTERLVKLGHEVTIIDKDLSENKLKNISSVIRKINLVESDLLNTKVLDEHIKNTEYIFHLAANSSVNKSLENPSWSAEQNILATIRLLETAIRYKVKRIIFSSSAAVYGYCKDLPIKESAPLIPASPYALEKITGEKYMKLFSELYDIDTVSLRYFNVYGPRQSADAPHPGGVTIVIKQILKTGSSQLMGNGKQTRDMIYVDDVVDANILSMQRARNFKGAVYNVCTGKSIVISDMHDMISNLMGVKPKREYIPFPEGNIVHSLGDNLLAKHELGFEAKTTLEEGLKKTIEWYRQFGE